MQQAFRITSEDYESLEDSVEARKAAAAIDRVFEKYKNRLYVEGCFVAAEEGDEALFWLHTRDYRAIMQASRCAVRTRVDYLYVLFREELERELSAAGCFMWVEDTHTCSSDNSGYIGIYSIG